MNTVDIIFCSLPYSEIDLPYSAPAILKSIVQNEGYTAKTKDFGMMLFDLCDRDEILLETVQNYFLVSENTLNEKEQKILNTFFDEIVKYFKSNPTKHIGISVFSILTHKCAFEVISRLKKENISSQIIIGGRGVKSSAYTPIRTAMNIRSIEKVQPYGDVLKNRKLVDHLVMGDGEDAILDILKDKQVKKDFYSSETFEYPVPDYSDYDLFSYKWKNDTPSFPITGSRGCVRNCDFCDIAYQFGKYTYRKGKDIANEMLKINKEYGFTKFNFTDSLVNGGLKPLEEFCTIIAEHNKNNLNNKLTWTGQYVCRESRFMPERLYKLMAESGAEGLTIGAESGSDHVLAHMDKKTSSTALLEELEMFRKYKITTFLLMLVGHWSEREEDFIDNCQVLYNLLPYIRSGTISMVSLGVTALVMDGTPVMNEVHEGKIITSDFDSEYVWLAKYNKTNTFKERLWRRLIISRISHFLSYPMDRELIWMNQLNVRVEKKHRIINDFFKKSLAQL